MNTPGAASQPIRQPVDGFIVAGTPRSRRVFWLQPAIHSVYAVAFFGVGAATQAPYSERVAVIALLTGVTMALAVRVSPVLSRAANAYRCSNGSTLKIVAGTSLLLTCVAYAMLFSRYGVPVFAADVERARMVPVVEMGPAYRTMNELIFLSLALHIVARGKRAVSRKRLVVVAASLFILLLSLGFRSRLVDYVAVAGVTAAYCRWAQSGSLPRLNVARFTRWSPAVVVGGLFVTSVTMLREGSSGFTSALGSTIDRTFLLNYRTNFSRIHRYVEAEGFTFGSTYVSDVFALFDPSRQSMQQTVTGYFNRANSDLFTMTPTVYGESYLNFGLGAALAVVPVILLYRAGLERAFLMLFRGSTGSAVSIGVVSVYIFYVPRVIATGGVSNAFIVKGLSILFAGLLVATVSSAVLRIRSSTYS